MSHRFTHRDSRLMNEVLNQGPLEICWAIALARQATAILRYLGVIEDNQNVSIQYLINSARSRRDQSNRNTWMGEVCSLGQASDFFEVEGAVLSTACRFSRSLRSTNPSFDGERRFKFVTRIHRRVNYRTRAEFDAELVRCATEHPVTAAIYSFRSFSRHIARNVVYEPRDDEKVHRERARRAVERRGGTFMEVQHAMLLCGSTDEEWIFQDSYGTIRRGDAGYVSVSKPADIITEFVEMIYVPEEGEESDKSKHRSGKRKWRDFKSPKRGGSGSDSKFPRRGGGGSDSKFSRRGRGRGNTSRGQGTRQHSDLDREKTLFAFGGLPSNKMDFSVLKMGRVDELSPRNGRWNFNNNKDMDSTSGNGAELKSANGSGLTDALPPPNVEPVLVKQVTLFYDDGRGRPVEQKGEKTLPSNKMDFSVLKMGRVDELSPRNGRWNFNNNKQFGSKSLIGEGSYGRVYYATLNDGKAVALNVAPEAETNAEFLSQVFHKRMPPEAIDLASRLLQYSPSLRYTALEACAHPFFNELREPNGLLPNGRPLPPLFNFKQEDMSAAVIEGSDAVTGHIISTTIGGKNGEPKQTIGYMAERVVGQGSFGIVFQGPISVAQLPKLKDNTKFFMTNSPDNVEPICYAHLATAQLGTFMKFEDQSETSSSHGGVTASGPISVAQLIPKTQKDNVANPMFFC